MKMQKTKYSLDGLFLGLIFPRVYYPNKVRQGANTSRNYPRPVESMTQDTRTSGSIDTKA
jgi:hypothetical protein